ncbi:MAG: hypothetical protein LBM02_09590 [Lachnospiraceae bacterium]|jgi:hypothetical protein|nr:hypothetical protein [Lachnospiraceae bacterium]
MVNKTYSVKSKDGKPLIDNDTKKKYNGASNGTHFWNLAIKTDAGYNKCFLYNKGTFYCKDKKVQTALYNQMKNDGTITNLKKHKDGSITYTWGI